MEIPTAERLGRVVTVSGGTHRTLYRLPEATSFDSSDLDAPVTHEPETEP